MAGATADTIASAAARAAAWDDVGTSASVLQDGIAALKAEEARFHNQPPVIESHAVFTADRECRLEQPFLQMSAGTDARYGQLRWAPSPGRELSITLVRDMDLKLDYLSASTQLLRFRFGSAEDSAVRAVWFVREAGTGGSLLRERELRVPPDHYLLNARQVCETDLDGLPLRTYLTLIFRDPGHDAFVRVDVPAP